VTPSEPPVLRLVRGTATAEELAAVVALLAARSGGGDENEAPVQRSLWSAPQLRGSFAAGPGAWRASGLPH
jgi:hypothetical protein